jgi:hypothetical protein
MTTEEFLYSFGKFASVFTKEQAIAKVNELFETQLKRAESENTKPNEGTFGDGDAKRAFWMLLDMQTQRLVFIQQCRSTAFWPRIRSLIGSPPFSFLLPRDDALLNPSGIRPNRAHMAPKEPASIFSSHEIGRGHFSDEHGRIYLAIASDSAREGALPFRAIVPGAKVVFDMKLPTQPNSLRSEIRKRGSSSAKKSIAFPLPNERLKLELHPDLRTNSTASLFVNVRTRQQRSFASPVVRLFCVAQAEERGSGGGVVA